MAVVAIEPCTVLSNDKEVLVANVFPPQKNACCSSAKRFIYGEEKNTQVFGCTCTPILKSLWARFPCTYLKQRIWNNDHERAKDAIRELIRRSPWSPRFCARHLLSKQGAIANNWIEMIKNRKTSRHRGFFLTVRAAPHVTWRNAAPGDSPVRLCLEPLLHVKFFIISITHEGSIRHFKYKPFLSRIDTRERGAALWCHIIRPK